MNISYNIPVCVIVYPRLNMRIFIVFMVGLNLISTSEGKDVLRFVVHMTNAI